MQVPLSNPNITAAEREAVLSVLNTPHLSLGPKVAEFEALFARFAGTRFAVAVNSGTSGLHLAIKAAGIEPGDQVVTTPFSFVASANCILYEGGVPVFADIDPVTMNIDPAQVERAVSSATRAILPVHVFGRPCDMPSLVSIAAAYDLPLIEDACEAIGATCGGIPIGSFGHTAVFAFYPNKQITTGEGGVILTSDDRAARLCRSWRNQGRGETGAWLQHERLGYNYRLSDINCALGVAQLERLPEILARREKIARLYTAWLEASLPDVVPPAPAAPGTEMSWFVYVVRLNDDYSREQRDGIIENLRKAGVACNSYFSPIHLQPFYRERFHYGRGDFPVTERISERTIALPFFTAMTEEQVAYVCTCLTNAVRQAGRRFRSVA